MICEHILLIAFLNKPEHICLHTVKWFQVFLCNSNNLTSIICLHTFGGARGVMVIIIENGHGDTSSNSGRD